MQLIECFVKFFAVPEFDIQDAKARIELLNSMQDANYIPYYRSELNSYLWRIATHRQEGTLGLLTKECLHDVLKYELLKFANSCRQKEVFYSYAFIDSLDKPVWKCANVVHILANESFERYKDVYKNLAGVIDDLSDNL